MAKTPGAFAQIPDNSTVDLLSDLLGSMRLSGVVMFRTEFHEPWSLLTPDGEQMAKLLGIRGAHIIPFHIIAQGRCQIELARSEPVWLDEGDVVLLPYGDAHTLSGQEQTASMPVGPMLPPQPWHEIFVLGHGGEGALTSMICGFLQCDKLLFHPVLRHLPPLIHVSPGNKPKDEWLASTIRHTAQEASQAQSGVRCMLPRLTELMFVEILRNYLHTLSANEVGWFAAINDPLTGAALKLLHTAPLQPWDVDTLARRVGTSRSVLADRFNHFLGQPPMQYLTNWRLQLAAQALMTSETPLKQVAEQAGYASEATFSRAFRRHFGSPPAEWRRNHLPA